MCGIAGIYNLDGRDVEPKYISNMIGELRHRGPDDTGEVLFNTDRAMVTNGDNKSSTIPWNLGFGHSRLKVIDLSSAGCQPMSNEDNSIWIIFNGMIYNYIELTNELKAKGYSFKSQSDTETILHSYEEYKEDCFSRFNGMWSLAIWDSRRKMLICSRDRFGVKPFYYFYDGHDFIFASEIKALLKHPKVNKKANHRTIYNYLSYNFGYTDISDETFFDGIKQILPAEYLFFKNGHMERKSYWDFKFGEKNDSLDDETHTFQFHKALEDSVRIRLRSDVPMGICLSGGLDSSSVACLVKRFVEPKKLKAFTVSFDDPEFNEAPYAEQVADYTGIQLHYVLPKEEKLFEDLPKLIWHQEEPFTNLNIYAQWLLMQEARREGVVVLLNGHGGDELLNGYAKEFYFFFADLLRTFKWSRLAKEISYYGQPNKGKGVTDIQKSLWIILSQLTPNSLKDLARRYVLKSNRYLLKSFVRENENYFYLERKFKRYLDSSSYMNYRISPLPGWLHAEDRISMAHSIESRSPFLDYHLVQLGNSLPTSQKFRDGRSKFILRSAMRGNMPENIRMRSDKMGYPTPTEKWIKGSLHDKAVKIFRSRQFSERGVFNPKEVLKALDEHCQDKKNMRFALWSWINLELWFNKFFD